METYNFNKFSIGISILSMAISIAAIFVSFKTSNDSDEQFNSVIQGYIEFEPTVQLYNEILNDPNIDPRQIFEIQGLSFGGYLQNIGSLPLKYKIVKFDIYFNDTMHKQLTAMDNIEALMYPKQSKTVNTGLAFFNSTRKPIQLSEARNIEIRCHVIIEYSDLNSSHKKKIEREYKTILHHSGSRVIWLRFADTI